MKEKNYRLSVPFMLGQIEKYGAAAYIRALREQGADTVVLALDCYQTDAAAREKVFAALRENVPLFKREGFSVGVWVWAFMLRGQNSYTHITSPGGRVSAEQVCPSDADFSAFASAYLQSIAQSRPDFLLFDDDFRYGFLDCGLGCACKNHRAHMEGLLGEKLPAGDISRLLFTGGKNKYRSAFLAANGHYLRAFAKMARAAVDTVDPTIRFGLCACLSTWDHDGVSAAELARILAGGTKPLLRLIGAPYWGAKRAWGNRLQDVIELERMESAWCGEDIELLAEGDDFPRPRFACPAAYLEGFDLAVRAAGVTDGILKYTLDYYASPDYEQGYLQSHIKNESLRAEIHRHFDGKTPVGVRVYEHMTKLEEMDIPAAFAGTDEVQSTFFSPAARLLAAASIPTVYGGLGTAGIAFGENVRYLEDGVLENGLVTDVRGAALLEKTGVDVGLAACGEEYIAKEEHFPEKKQFVALFDCPATAITLKKGAKIESIFVADGEEQIGSYSYVNAKGQKFLVFAFDGYTMSEHACKQPARGAQIEEWIHALGKRLPVSLHGNPDCYLLCKENESGRAVFIGNFFPDACMHTTLTLDRPFKNVGFICCRGRMEGNRITLDGIPPYATLGFFVYD